MDKSLEISGEVSAEKWEHPALKTELILENIFVFCSVKMLKECRLVSKFWRDSAIKPIRNQTTVKLANRKAVSRFVKFGEKKPIQNLYANFYLEHYSRKIPIYTMFWINYGDQVKILEISKCECTNLDAFCELIFEYCPNMQQLTLDKVGIKKDCGESGMNRKMQFKKHYNLHRLNLNEQFRNPISWLELFGNFPRITAFEYTGKTSLKKLDEIFTAVETIRKEDPNSLKLTKIHICNAALKTNNYYPFGMRYNRHHIPRALQNVLLDPKLPIQNLSLSTADNGNLGLREIFKVHRNTLKVLQVHSQDKSLLNYYDHTSSLSKLDERMLPNLREFTLLSPLISSLAILRFTPNLVKLSINFTFREGNIISNTDVSAMDGFQLGSLRKLELLSRVSPSALRKLFGWLPNIKMLKMSLNNVTFPVVCEVLPNLEELDVENSEVDEWGLTGMDIEDTKLINEHGENFSGRLATVPRANLSCLKHLRKLSLRRLTIYDHSLNLCAVLFGIQQAPCLEEVVVKNYKVDNSLWKRLVPHVDLKVELECERRIRLAQGLAEMLGVNFVHP